MPHVWDADTQRVIAGNSSEDSPAAPTELAQIAATPLENRNERASDITNQRRHHHHHLSQRRCRLQRWLQRWWRGRQRKLSLLMPMGEDKHGQCIGSDLLERDYQRMLARLVAVLYEAHNSRLLRRPELPGSNFLHC